MGRKARQLAVYLTATAAILFMALRLGPAELIPDHATTNCRQILTSDCLARLGIAAAMRDTPLPPYSTETYDLAKMGFFEEALVLEASAQEHHGLPPDAARLAAQGWLAGPVIAASIKDGQSPQAAFASTLQAGASDMYFAGLDLLGQKSNSRSADAATRQSVSDLAKLIAVQPAANANIRESNLIYAAELQAALQDRAESVLLLAQLPADGPHDFALSDALVRLVGPDNALALCDDIADCRWPSLLAAARAAPTPDAAKAYLEEAFRIPAARQPWPDYDRLERVVQVALGIEQPEFAVSLARQIVTLAATRDYAFPAVPQIFAARSLANAGAAASEIRESLNRAEAAVPADENAAVGFGLVSGPIIWGSSGIGAQTQWELANLRARIGDSDAAIRLMAGAAQPELAWRNVITPDLPIETITALLPAAGQAMTVEDSAYVRACLARDMVWGDPSPQLRDWAIMTTQAVLSADLFAGKRANWIYNCAANTAKSLGNQTMYRAALRQMGLAAMATGDTADLLRAATAWHDFETVSHGQ